MNKVFRLILCFGLLTVLPSCWDIKDLQTINYITAIGLDYKDGKYIIYAQLLDFTSIAKQETGKVSSPPSMWVGKGVGDSINLAANDLYKSSQQPSSFSHLSAIVFTRNFLQDEMVNAADTLFRYREIRHTPWVYGTDDSIEVIFNSPGFFNLTTLNTILSEPLGLYRQHSMIAPMQLVKLVALWREPGRTILLPSIYVNEKDWRRNEKPEKKLALDGIFALHDLGFQGKLTREEIKGSRWMEPRVNRSPLEIIRDGQNIAVISITKEHDYIHISDHAGGTPTFELNLHYTGSVVEVLSSTTEEELIELGEKKIEEEIRQTYSKSLEKNVDILNLEHALYRKDYPTWKKLHDDDRFQLTADSLKAVHVHLKISNSGMDRLQKKNQPPEG